uniref:Laminin N-terminal domain-containing protein n=1 Tax=Hippocampus comes TaxID=109280 RepID=A0A3Q3D6T4_HIPCM
MDARLAVWFHLLARFLPPAGASMDSCYDEETAAPGRCLPKFENVAFNRSVLASNQCGSAPEEFCMQMGSAARSCHLCDASVPGFGHGAALLTDFHRNEEPTWWQSQSMYFGIQHPNSVNLTLRLGKAFEITYVRLKFYASRPESFAIYRRSEADGPWLPYQFYSASCGETYGKAVNGFLRLGDDERTALCTNEFSDIAPLTGGDVAFSTLEGRPSAYNFDRSLVLQVSPRRFFFFLRMTYVSGCLAHFLRLGDDERTALCTNEFSDIAPLTGGDVAFSTLEGRPSAYNFDRSLVLQVSPRRFFFFLRMTYVSGCLAHGHK